MNVKNESCGKLKTSIVVLSIYIIFIAMCSIVAADTLFYDEFSATHPLDSGWTGEYAEDPITENLYADIYSGISAGFIYDGYYAVTKDDAALIASINTTGYESIVLSYYRKTYSANSTDMLVVEWRVGNSSSWLEIENTFPFDAWTPNTYAFDNTAENTAEIQIRFWMDDGDNDYSLWDNVLVEGEPMFIAESSEYTNESDCITAGYWWCPTCQTIYEYDYGFPQCVDSAQGCHYNGCTVACGAGCDATHYCPDTECDGFDGCYGDYWRDYTDVPNLCLGNCTCEDNICDDYTETNCDDGIACTIDLCDDIGGCSNVPDDSLCNDGNVCTTDSCDASAGCVHINNNDPCDDDNLCTENDVCSAGACSGTDKDCGDGNECTTDSCDPLTGDCVHDCQEGNSCNDGNDYTVNDVCLDYQDICVCMGTSIDCFYDSECDDDLYCNGVETCDLTTHTCLAGTPVNCDDGVDCTDDTCDEEQDRCNHQNKPYGTDCGLSRDCPDNYCIDPYLYEYPADGHDYCDGAGSCVVYSCDSTGNECNYNDCNAECDEANPCEDSTCSETYGDYCLADGLTLMDYNEDEILNNIIVSDSCSNNCLDGCVCEDCGVDCSEPNPAQVDCSFECPLSESPETSCDDGYDNDCDGLVDLEDADCQSGKSTLKITATPDSVLGNRFYFRVFRGSCEEDRGRYNTEQTFICETGSVVKISTPKIRIDKYFLDRYDIDGVKHNIGSVKVTLDNSEHVVTLEYITLKEKIERIMEMFRKGRN